MSARGRVLPGVLLGVGLGAFLDGIVMHQLLGWHHMVSDEGCCPAGTLAGLEDNTVADGAFHAVAWLVTVAGVAAAVRAWQAGDVAPPWSRHLGAMLAGWGLFNVADSANHFVLGLHHIRDDLGGPVGWDIGFLAFGLLLVAAGGLLARAAPGGRGAQPPSAGPSRSDRQ